jgi:hypothetical protein
VVAELNQLRASLQKVMDAQLLEQLNEYRKMT